MAKKVVVTKPQVEAAKLLVSRSAVTGRYVSSGIRRIAKAGQPSVRAEVTHRKG